MSKRQRIMPKNKRWDEMTSYEREQVSQHILCPLTHQLLDWLAFLVWEYMEQGVYEACDCVTLEAKQNNKFINLLAPVLESDYSIDNDKLLFSIDGFQSQLEVSVLRYPDYRSPVFEFSSCETVYFEKYNWEDRWKFCASKFETSPNYVMNAATDQTQFLKLFQDEGRIYALFEHELLMFENKELLVRLGVPYHLFKHKVYLGIFQDMLVYQQGLIVALCCDHFEFQIHYLQF